MMQHIPVMLKESINTLSPTDGELYLDCTFGGGSYTRAILESANCKVIALDRDPYVKDIAEEVSKKDGNRFRFYNKKFSEVDDIIKSLNISKISGIILDIGVSSFQIDDENRGFSFRKSGDLDMRMGLNEISALDLINKKGENELADIIFEYGEEHCSRRIAKAIKRHIRSIKTTKDLADVVHSVLPFSGKKDSATRTFQALRMYVNNELEELEFIIRYAISNLADNGRLVVVSFHSLEDRVIKRLFSSADSVKIITKKPVTPSVEEVSLNPRSRSAKMRALVKLDKHNGLR